MTLLRVKAKNHPLQTRRRGPSDITDDRRVPLDFWWPLHQQYGFTVDVAASVENAMVPKFYTVEEDGCKQSWADESVWCNPPYSNVRPWVEKAWSAMNFEACRSIVMLVPANRTEQAWWQKLVEPMRDNGAMLRVRFLAGRLRFTRPNWVKPEKGDRPPFGSALLIWESRSSLKKLKESQ